MVEVVRHGATLSPGRLIEPMEKDRTLRDQEDTARDRRPATRDDSMQQIEAVPDAPRRTAAISLLYDPPYESELDDALARNLVAYLVPAAGLEYKAEIQTVHSVSRFDFLIDLGTRRIAIDYTDTPDNLETALVEDNDALVLGSDLVDGVFRIRRSDLERNLYDCLHLICKWEPNLFTPYGHRVFASHASDEARGVYPEPEASLAWVYYRQRSPKWLSLVIDDTVGAEVFEWPESGDEDDHIVVRKMSREHPEYWRRQYERASLVYGRAPIRRTRHF